MEERVLILGGNGLMGGELAKRLRRRNKQITLVDLRKPVHLHHAEFIQADILEEGAIAKLVSRSQPHIIVNCVNVATISSKHTNEGFHKLTKFYFHLYKSLSKLDQNVHYIQIGTTGSGGLGFNIPFTHGDKIEDFPIVNKAAFSGITTAMLVLLSRSFPQGIKISELKPGLAVFKGEVTQGDVDSTKLVVLDGGESGHYTYDEVALLTSFMGFTTVSRLIDKVLQVLDGKKSPKSISTYDVVENVNSAIIAPDSVDITKKANILLKMRELSDTNYIIATGNLGPPSITKDLILGFIVAQHSIQLTKENFRLYLKNELVIKNTLEYIKNRDSKLYKYLKQECTYDNYVSLSKYQCGQAQSWKIVLSKLKSFDKRRVKKTKQVPTNMLLKTGANVNLVTNS